MSKTTTALIVKFVMTFVFAAAAFMFIDRNPWTWVLVVGILGTILNYLFGDLFVLPKWGNIGASIVDGILAGVTAYVVNLIVPAFKTSYAGLIAFAALVAVGEYYFHRYLKRSEKVAP
ncbi:MAG: DUF2512 family protein [Bacillota bacterium]